MKSVMTLFTAIVIFSLSFVASAKANGSEAEKQEFNYLSLGNLRVHHGEFAPKEVVGDVLYLHGYGDSFVNHQKLFKSFNDRGLRVIAFDYPSHGLTQGGRLDDLDFQSFAELTHIAAKILKQYRMHSSRPLLIAGWSTGGLHAVRIAQKSEWRELFPGLSGLILYAPGVSVKKCVGNSVCHITNKTLTHDQSLWSRTIEPKSPLYRVNFASMLLYNAWLSWQQPLPHELPTLLFVAGESDRYTKSVEIKNWLELQQTKFKANISAIQCGKARHELDNELPEYGGDLVKSHSAAFAQTLALGSEYKASKLEGACESID